MDIRKTIPVILLLSSFSGQALAQGEPGTGPNPFTDCGIGAALFPNTHWAAVTSNIIWDIGTTAVISATASPETCEGAKVEAALFIRDTYDNVIQDTAKGQGAHTTALLEIFGCPASSHESMLMNVRERVSGQVATENYVEKTNLQRSSDYYMAIQYEVDKPANNCSA